MRLIGYGKSLSVLAVFLLSTYGYAGLVDDVETNGLPSEISGGASTAPLGTAADFAWQQFIYFNWPSMPQNGALGRRGVPDFTVSFGDPAFTGPTAWESDRHKVELNPGTGIPVGCVTVDGNPGPCTNAGTDYGYDALPRYVYDPAEVGSGYSYPSGDLPDGEVAACNDDDYSAGMTPPWINLDETTQIGFDTMNAGAGPTSPFPGQQFLFLAQANRVEYTYVAPLGWYSSSAAGESASSDTADFVAANQTSPAPDSNTMVSFPYGTVEFKGAYRQLTTSEYNACIDGVGTCNIHTQAIRLYQKQNPNQSYGGQPGNADFSCWVDDVWALSGLHIIQKIPDAPFTFATFGHIDNILNAEGERAEEADGTVKAAFQSLSPFEPSIGVGSGNDIEITLSTPTSSIVYTPESAVADCVPESRTYYVNQEGSKAPQGPVCVNKRIHDIPAEIIAVNQSYQQAIKDYAIANNLPYNVWSNYKLVNIQAVPIDKTPGVLYAPAIPSDLPAATYYLSNIVVETDYSLQEFSGGITGANLISDYTGGGDTDFNTFHGGNAFLMGGCMGCHGVAQKIGKDFSFIFNDAVEKPEFAEPDPIAFFIRPEVVPALSAIGIILLTLLIGIGVKSRGRRQGDTV